MNDKRLKRLKRMIHEYNLFDNNFISKINFEFIANDGDVFSTSINDLEEYISNKIYYSIIDIIEKTYYNEINDYISKNKISDDEIKKVLNEL